MSTLLIAQGRMTIEKDERRERSFPVADLSWPFPAVV